MTERIEDPAQAPAVLVGHVGRWRGTSADRLREHRIWIVGYQQGPARCTADCLRAEPRSVRSARGNPERGVSDRQLRDDLVSLPDAMQGSGAESCLIELDSGSSAIDPQFRLYTRHAGDGSRRPARQQARSAATGCGRSRLHQLARSMGWINADSMRLFHKAPPARPALQRRVPRPWDPPQTEFPGIVPISTLQFDRSEQAAIAITGMSAYSNGFEIFVTALIHPGGPGFDAETPDGGMLANKPYQISLKLSDGRTVTSGRPYGDSEPTEPILQLRGGGTSHYQHSSWWAWPLPPSGPLEFVCCWPTLGTGETRVGTDAQLILDAAGRSSRLWPEAEDLPSAG